MLNIKKIKQLLNKLEDKPFTPNFERGGEKEEKLIKGCISLTRTQASICWGSVLVTVGLATVFTLMKRIRSSDYHDWEFTYGPLTVLNVTYTPNYEITWLYQIICTSTIGFNHSTINLIMAGILAHSSVQFKVLQNNLRRIVQNAHGFMMKVCYSIFRNVLIAFLLEMNDMRMVKTVTDTVTALFPVLLLCFWSQEVVYESQQVARAAVEGNLVGADLRFQKSLNLITVRSQRPIQLKAGKIIEISLPTFVSIVRASYSAFMVLRKVNTEV
ncbi:hypothetical protein ILUMI_02043 [Ignelater luminosus]|uniref:Uncharacterized protein n=1 Tax=Ignelater luminosus TaxID=2038154 RepID=A0A8K0DJ01_IGNLU|nr:hypothetical protein ILUMI_02043 [Ignelater luminosus]